MEQPVRQYDRSEAAPQATSAPARTLVIDLEGALLRSELLMEALFSAPARMLARFGAGGRAGHGGADGYSGARRARLRPPSL